MGFSKIVQKYHNPVAKRSNATDGLHSNYKSPKDHPIEININIESPPCVLYGSATESSGALLSGLVTLKIKNPYCSTHMGSSVTPVTSTDKSKRKSTLGTTLSSTFSNLSVTNSQPTSLSPSPSSNLQIMAGYTKVTITSVTLTLVQKVHFHKPFVPDLHSAQSCMNCQSKTTDMKNWVIQKTSKDLSVGQYSFPFSYLIPGSFPANAALGSNSETTIKYELIAVVTYKDPKRGVNPHQSDQLLQLVMPVPVTRSLPRGPDKNSLRVFPPTELTATAVLPSVVYPKSTFPLEMKIEGISCVDRRWRMRKLSWRIEEITRIRNHACDVHKHELKKLEKTVKHKEDHKPKKEPRRYGDQGPQVRVSVSTADNTPLPVMPSLSEQQQRASASSSSPRDQDLDENEDEAGFVHPNDDALRQEILQQQQRLREQQLEQELKNDSNLFTEEVRTVTRGDMKSGWKTDFDNNGQVELITEIDCMPLNSGVTNPITSVSTAKPQMEDIKQHANVACDIQDPALGVYVIHILAVEVVVAEEALQYTNGQPVKHSVPSTSSNNSNSADQRLAELSPMFANRNPSRANPVAHDEVRPTKSANSSKSATSVNSVSDTPRAKVVSVPTGAARVLRMQFRINLTERSGLGISWDEEVPPIYQDVKMLSPPSYASSISKSPPPKFTSLVSEDSSGSSDNHLVPLMSNPLSTPPMAHHHDSSSSLRGLTTVQSPQLDSVVSIQGNVPFQNSVLTPHGTRDTRIRNFTELMDTDRITQ
ncbi:related to Protein LDB19 [Zygosaccharomyces bailii ISA1307]|uniref:ZYBA0S07-04368g1_1 n=1 Tax=Zygosaccharomyces bailii (strain CLIB 213 / ATCC 58445 / CBS 680 / BCRC 21525 / NBRC 1098 / NCYC 1416 / NRRL Y-2227) TaxID=1333698 RepID=A0A8J2T9A8_ZYGB2|nr:ZYBA0S07-04368g1_1 [Zygosaccharomyces bailii CLIB 213]CDH15050.1 related to Protein LDB19 [Zygosaccharomyces bailii ISA1307]